jgi:bifunctional non-homologous end joining protein LigD
MPDSSENSPADDVKISHKLGQVINSVTLHNSIGSSDKIYKMSVVCVLEGAFAATGAAYQLRSENGRRGSTMVVRDKFTIPVSLIKAQEALAKKQKEQIKDGYVVIASSSASQLDAMPAQLTAAALVDANALPSLNPKYLPMLPADLPLKDTQRMLTALMNDEHWAMQQKMDGENRILVIGHESLRAYNKRGVEISPQDSWRPMSALSALALMPSLGGQTETVLYGEHIGEKFFVFDINPVTPNETLFSRSNRLAEFMQQAPAYLPPDCAAQLVLVKTISGSEKIEHNRQILEAKGEGVVYKDLRAPFSPGKNTQSFRSKFWETATVFVDKHNDQRSVSVYVTATNGINASQDERINLGNVSIPVNHAIPEVGSMVEVRYLYWNEGGSLIQPTYLGVRTDVEAHTVTTEQIRRIKPRGAVIDLNSESVNDEDNEDVDLSGDAAPAP